MGDHMDRWTTARDDALQVRLKTQTALSEVTKCMRHLEESRIAVLRNVSDKAAHDQFQRDSAELAAAIDAYKPLAEQINRIDSELGRLDDESSREDQIKTGILRRGGLHNSWAADQPLPGTLGIDDEVELPDKLGHYFNVLGDIGLTKERLLDELPAEIADQRAERQHLRDQERPLAETDDQFEASCVRKKDSIEAELEQLRRRASNLKAQCIALGYETDPAAWTRRSPSEVSHDIARSANIERWLGTVGTPSELGPDPLPIQEGSQAAEGRFLPVLPVPFSEARRETAPRTGVGSERSQRSNDTQKLVATTHNEDTLLPIRESSPPRTTETSMPTLEQDQQGRLSQASVRQAIKPLELSHAVPGQARAFTDSISTARTVGTHAVSCTRRSPGTEPSINDNG